MRSRRCRVSGLLITVLLAAPLLFAGDDNGDDKKQDEDLTFEWFPHAHQAAKILHILDANPLDDICSSASIHQVMKNGELFDGDTLDHVYPQQKPLAPLWWWDEDPNRK